MREGSPGFTNPFRPGAGRPPPFLAGRESETALLDEALEDLARGSSAPQGVLLYGPRGNGKTALIAYAASRAKRLGLRAEDLPVLSLRSEDSLIRLLQERSGLAGRRITGVQVGPLGASVEGSAPSTDIWQLLVGWIERDRRPLLVLLDEVQTLDPTWGGAFLHAAQFAVREARPFLLVAAGTPDAPRRLREAGTFTERMLVPCPIGRLSTDASRQALQKPAADRGRPFDEDGLELLVSASQNYPYFIQVLGSAAWRGSRQSEGRIGRSVAQHAIREAKPRIERFYGDRFQEAERRGVCPALPPLARLLSSTVSSVGDGALREVLRGVAEREEDVVRLKTDLLDLGVVWESDPGRWEMGIPSFADHVLRRAAIGSANAQSPPPAGRPD